MLEGFTHDGEERDVWYFIIVYVNGRSYGFIVACILEKVLIFRTIPIRKWPIFGN